MVKAGDIELELRQYTVGHNLQSCKQTQLWSFLLVLDDFIVLLYYRRSGLKPQVGLSEKIIAIPKSNLW